MGGRRRGGTGHGCDRGEDFPGQQSAREQHIQHDGKNRPADRRKENAEPAVREHREKKNRIAFARCRLNALLHADQRADNAGKHHNGKRRHAIAPAQHIRKRWIIVNKGDDRANDDRHDCQQGGDLEQVVAHVFAG